MPTVETNEPQPEDEVTKILQALRDDIRALHRARSSQVPVPEARIAELEGLVRVGMARVAQIHPDPDVRADYRARLARLEGARDESEKWDVLIGVAKGLGLVLAAPFAIVAGAILLAGSIVQGTGQVLKGLGTILTRPFLGQIKK